MSNYINSCSLILTESCNLSCLYCFEKNKKKSNMTQEVAENTIEFLIQQAILGEKDKISITYFGGEPLLNFEVLKESFYYGVRRTKEENLKFDCSIITNATFYTDEYESFLLDWHNTLGKINIQFSIDGEPHIQDYYRPTSTGGKSSVLVEETLKKHLDLFEKNNIPSSCYSAHGVINSNTINNVYNNFLYLKGLGIEHVWFMPCHEEKWLDEHYDIYREQLELISNYIIEDSKTNKNAINTYSSLGKCLTTRPDKPCSAGCSFCTITPDGDIYPCHHFYFNDKTTCIGDIYEGVDDAKRKIFLDYSFDNIFGDTSCKDCSNKSCYTCIAANYTHNGNMLIGFPDYCKLQKIEDEFRQKLHEKINGVNIKSNDHLLDEVLKDRKVLLYTIEQLQNNITDINSKMNTLLDIVVLLSTYLVEGENTNENN